jgi:hypothetical protein
MRLSYLTWLTVIACVSVVSTAPAQTITHDDLIKLSQRLAYEWGRIYQQTVNCNLTFEWATPGAAAGFFVNYMTPADVQSVIAPSFEEAMKATSKWACDRQELRSRAEHLQGATSAYIATAAPFLRR